MDSKSSKRTAHMLEPYKSQSAFLQSPSGPCVYRSGSRRFFPSLRDCRLSSLRSSTPGHRKGTGLALAAEVLTTVASSERRPFDGQDEEERNPRFRCLGLRLQCKVEAEEVEGSSKLSIYLADVSIVPREREVG